MIKYVTIKKFEELTGYTEDAVRTKIRDGVWLQNQIWVKAYDGRVLMSVEGYNEWVEMAAVSAKRQKRVMKSPLPIKVSGAGSESNSSPPPLTING